MFKLVFPCRMDRIVGTRVMIIVYVTWLIRIRSIPPEEHAVEGGVVMGFAVLYYLFFREEF